MILGNSISHVVDENTCHGRSKFLLGLLLAHQQVGLFGFEIQFVGLRRDDARLVGTPLVVLGFDQGLELPERLLRGEIFELFCLFLK